jgi:hypothetical protein
VRDKNDIQQTKPLEVRSKISGAVIPHAQFDDASFVRQRSGLKPGQALQS